MKKPQLLLRKIYAKLNAYNHDPVKNQGSTEFEIDNGVISHFVLKKLVPVVGVGPFALNELMLMAGSICRFRPQYVFDWGTHIGKSARIFYETAKYFKIPTEVHSIDLPEEVERVWHPHSKRGKLVKGKSGVYLHLGDGLDTALRLYKTFPTGSRILCFVDGDHEYESVKRELMGISAGMPNAKILVHDTFFQSPDSGYNIGPFKAVMETLSSGHYKLLETKTGVPGMSLLY